MTGIEEKNLNLTNQKWQSWGQTEIGPLHIKLGTPNQDSWLTKHFYWGDVIVVSDGLGSKTLSEQGSQAACSAVINMAEHWFNFPETTPERLLSYLHECWLFKIKGMDVNECACTCLFVIRLFDKVFIAQLGDGLLAMYKERPESIKQLSMPYSEGNFSNQTEAFKSEFSLKDWQYQTFEVEDVDAFLLCTDGISDDLEPVNLGDFVKDIYQYYRFKEQKSISEELTAWLKNWPVPKHSDDKTIACLFK